MTTTVTTVNALDAPATLLARAETIAAALADYADAHDRAATLPVEGIASLWEAGLGNLTLASKYGGAGVDLVSASRIVARVSAGDASVGLVWVMHILQSELLLQENGGWPAAAREAVIASARDEPALINALRVEPELGTPARGGVPATRAVLGEDEHGTAIWRISGRKTFCTGSTGLRWMLVWAATADDDPEGVRTGPFLVDARAPGITIEETWDHHGLRASVSHDVIFDNTPVPAAFHGVLTPAEEARPGPPDLIWTGRMVSLLMSVYLGVAQAARDWLVGYLHERVPTNLGASLATLPRFQTAVGRIESRLTTVQRLLIDLAADIESDRSTAEAAGARAGIVKQVAGEQLILAVDEAVSLVGNAGLSRRNPIERHLRDVLCGRVHAPQDDMVLLNTGRAVLDREVPKT